MIQIAVLSGKGGTGKTVVTGALAELLPGKKVFADCDVEAANLALLLSPRERSRIPFFGMKKAMIEKESCVACGLCAHACRFGAIRAGTNGLFSVDPVRCEGCGVCAGVCPERAIVLRENQDGEIILADTDLGPLVYAELKPGSGNSGLLVHEVKKAAHREVRGQDLVLIDGPPGIGCPVISTMSGIHIAVIVTEPGIAAMHDLKRLVTVSRGFSLSLCAIINRADLHEGYAQAIGRFCADEEIPLLGKVPFDPTVQAAVRKGVPVTRFGCPATAALRDIAANLAEILGEKASDRLKGRNE
ncbi:MAG: ATP-binding protein [Methanolinea sp.]|nr:ATP-binding protein [Methanolinea sp.]